MNHKTLRFFPLFAVMLLAIANFTSCDLIGGIFSQGNSNKESSDQENKESNNQENSDQEVKNANNEASLYLTKPSGTNLGTVIFFGNSHTFRTDAINTLAQQNGYQLNAENMGAGGWVALGVDAATIAGNIDPVFFPKHVLEGGCDSHISAFLKRAGAELCNDKLTWIIVHDGTVYNSLTSSGAFMGLANAFGGKVACYQSWDLLDLSDYAAQQFNLPIVPIGSMILEHWTDYNKGKDDCHMSDLGAYVFAVSFFHFFSGMPIDNIKGDAGIAGLKEEDMTAARKVIKDTLLKQKKYPAYFDAFEDGMTPSLEKADIIQPNSSELVSKLALGKSVAFKLPSTAAANQKLTVTATSSDTSIVPDFWFYDPSSKKIIAQGYNRTNVQSYTYIGSGSAWEQTGECYLIVTRRGVTSTLKQMGDRDASGKIQLNNTGDPYSSIVAEITEADAKPDFTVTVSFVDN